MHARQSELEKMGASALSHLVLAQMTRIEHLELLVARLKRSQYGQKSEKAVINVEQLALGLDGCVIESQPAAPAEPPPTHKDKTALHARTAPWLRICSAK
jgi:Transposase C of IS166 homeodomain